MRPYFRRGVENKNWGAFNSRNIPFSEIDSPIAEGGVKNENWG